MKHIYLAILFIFLSFSSFSQNQPFVTTWEVTVNDLSITIPTHPGSTYNYTVDFGDGTVLNNQTGDAMHTYNVPDNYTINITGTFPRIYFNFNSDRKKIMSVDQWGDIQWQSMESAFKGCTNLVINATDAPDLSQVINLSSMFESCQSLNQSINHWNVSNVTNMAYMFSYASYNQPLNSWDVSNVVDMSNMFYGSLVFNQPLNNWNVSNVTNMEGLFSATPFNQNINNWDVSNVTDMSRMFASSWFNHPLDNWNVSNVIDMSYMFRYTELFDQPLNNWDVSNVTDMSYMFEYAKLFDQPLNNWDVSSVTNMEGMFKSEYQFNQPLNNWDVSNVTNMAYMFLGAHAFNQNINNWDVSNVTDMSYMFRFTQLFDQPLNNWDVSNVTDMSYMFENTHLFDQPLNNWDVSNVTNMNMMFSNAEEFNQSLNSWNVSNVLNMEYMFNKTISFNQPLNSWNVSSVTNMEGMFWEAEAFNQNINNWNVSNVTNMYQMFRNAMSYNQPLNNWNVSNVTNMDQMFRYAISYNQPLDNWDVSNVTNMQAMFDNTNSFNQDISFWNFNPNVNFGGFWSSDFISNTSMDIKNYEKLLDRFVNLNIHDKGFGGNNLLYCSTISRDELINNRGWIILGDAQSQNCNSITGVISLDENNNGCDPNDAGISGFMVNANNGSANLKAYSVNGNFEIGTLDTNFTVSVMNYPNYYTVTPASQQVTFTTSSTEVADFCVTANQTIEDLNVTLLPTSEARPGFEADYQLVIENIGTQTLANATVTLDFDDSMQSFVSASVAPISTTTNQLTFDITNLQPLTFQTVDLTMQTFQPPTVNGDDILSFTANVTPDSNDYTPNDNNFIYDQIVVNSYDPNDKQVLQGEELEIDNSDEYLDYLIRFQNTGTASAINVRILDTLHPKLDYSTLKPINASHSYRIEITNDHEVEFIFEGINLPHESANEPASHGFVAYKIKPKTNVAVGDFITGDANIYFDFNAPIITNMVSTEIIDNIVGTENPMANEIVVYPNPTQSVLNIETRNNQQIEAIKIYNLHGLEIQTFKGNQKQLNVENLSSGVYFVKVITNEGVVTKRILKN